MTNINDIDEENLPNYRIFWVDDKRIKHVVLKFKALNDDEAYAKLKDFDSSHDDHVYYYGIIHYCKCINSSGDKMFIRELNDHAISWDDSKKNVFLRVVEKIGDFFAYWIYYKPIDLWYKLKDIIYLLKYNEARSNQWNLDYHLLDSIELNVPSLIKYSHCMMFLDEAILQLYGNDAGFDLKKYHESHCACYPKEVEDLAMKIQHDEYNKLLLYVKQYKYYSNYGIIDIDDPDAVEFDNEWRHTLPVKLGTYDEYDYEKLEILYNTAWNNIWDWVKKYGHTLND